MPLFAIQFPSNAQFMYSMIIGVSNFELIPDSIKNKVYEIVGLNPDEDDDEDSENV